MIKEAYNRLNKRRFWGSFAVLATVISIEIVLTVLIPEWREHFYNTLQEKDLNSFHMSLVYFTILMLGMGAATGTKAWVAHLFSFQMRTGATKLFHDKWKGNAVKNLTQAFSDSLYKATEMYTEVVKELFISGMITIVLIVNNLDKPVVLVAAVIYTISISGMAALFSKPMVRSDMKWQTSEGDLRETISDVTAGGSDSIMVKFGIVAKNYYRYIRISMYFTLFSRVKGALASLVPYILLAGHYFSGETTLGEFMGSVAIFELLVVNATILVIEYPYLNKARAGMLICKSFYEEINA